MKFCSFDIETYKITDDDIDLFDQRPLGVACAATICSGDEKPVLWHGELGKKMSQPCLTEMIRYLEERLDRGFVPLTFNGLWFEFNILHEEADLFEECKRLAMEQVDIMFQFFCLKGFRVGLDPCLVAMGFPGKSASDMTGADAPKVWRTNPEKVLHYVGQDVIQPLQLAEKVEKKRSLTWRKRNGNYGNVPIDRWRTVEECLTLPLPDTSWMNDPQTRESFFSWIDEYEREKAAYAGLPLFQ